MLPTLQPGDRLSVLLFDKPKPLNKLSAGQVVLVQEKGQWVTHRLIQHNDKIFCKGDWAYQKDDASWVWGKVIAVNQNQKALLGSPWMAKLSALDLQYQNPWFRRLRKVCLWTYAKLVLIVRGVF